MLVTLARKYLGPYRWAVVAVLVLQLVQTLAALYLPSLNADIIDDGVVLGDIGHIWRTGGWMLVVSLGQVAASVVAVYFGAQVATAFGRDLRRDLFHTVQTFSAREMAQFGAPTLITRGTNDVQQVQMTVLMTFTIMVMAPIMLVGGVILALSEDVTMSGAPAGHRAGAGRDGRRHRVADGAALPAHAEAHRRDQRRAARADHRPAGGARVRA